MLESFKRWIGGKPAHAEWAEVSTWAEGAGYRFKRVRDNEGFVVDGASSGAGWRLEVGPPQRAYIDGPELRIRGDAELPPDLQMLLMSRQLMDTLERETYAKFTDPVKTYADDSTPEEMRWLAMFPKVDTATLGELALRFGAAALRPETVRAWLGGNFREQLAAAAVVLPAERPLVLMTNRARVTLRTLASSVDVTELGDWIALFEAAVARLPEVRRAMRELSG